MSDSESFLCSGQGIEIENISPYHQSLGGEAKAPCGMVAYVRILPSKGTLYSLLANQWHRPRQARCPHCSLFNPNLLEVPSPPPLNLFSPSGLKGGYALGIRCTLPPPACRRANLGKLVQKPDPWFRKRPRDHVGR